MTQTFTGKIVAVNPVQQISENYKKQTVWISDNAPQYPQTLEFVLSQKIIGIMDNLAPGAELSVTFNLKGRLYEKNGKSSVFNSLEIFKFDLLNTTTPQPSAQTAQSQPAASPDDLPF
ncbi:DUF3127 domain-containing protein [Polluticaenibacter yanchengensis]|uniref:DUF3127 domain-containing protein n=1 Tax=Polluticaenibacter yanchengensis TaxID=3014562 RepID=A0ABT4UIT4_9BACT|nr:DUF3127 domain-containing protein [Chitinophagaceae bacterium LY-5]